MFRFILGTIKFTIRTKQCESVINRLRHSVQVSDIKMKDSECVELSVLYRYKADVLSILDSLDVKIQSECSYGLPALIDKYKKRAGIWLGLLLSVVALIVSSLMIWEIRVYGNTYVADGDIVRLLKQLGISEGRFIDKSILETAYNDFLIKEPRISWISVNYDGTVAKVEVKEKELVPEKLDRNKNINVVAGHDGVVKRVDVFDGKAEVAAGDAVIKGQLLISSFTEARKTGTFMRAARGHVWASTVHSYEITVNKRDLTRNSNSSIKNKHSIIVLGNRIPLYLQYNSDNIEYDVDVEYKRCLLLEKFPMPFSIETKKQRKYHVQSTDISMEDARYKAEKELAVRLEMDMSDAEIIEKTESMYENESAFVFKYELLCIENIACSQEFEFE